MTHEEKWTASRYWGSRPLPKEKTEFFNAVTMVTPSNETIATLRLYGPIDSYGGLWGISTSDVAEALDALPKSVTQIIVRFNSPGGEVFEGMSILNMLRAHSASITAVVDGMAASAASVIAAGCDETVMSPGTQMMIHSTSVMAIGNAAELRKQADVLDGLDASLIEIFTAKAGEKDWPALLSDETWMTAADAVEIGLADRVGIVPDAGETTTVKSAPEEDYPISDTTLGKAVALSTKPPSSPEPGESKRKENVMEHGALVDGLRERLGLTDADISDEQLLEAVDEVLTAPPIENPTVPEGTQLIDSTVLADLQASAAEGRAARAQQATERREHIVADALKEGRITAASRATWLAQLEANEEGTALLLNSLPKNTVPVAEVGISATEETADDALYNSLYPKGA